MKSFTGILHAHVAAAVIRQTDKGKEFLSIKADPIADKPGEDAPPPVWVTSFHKTHIAAKLSEGMRIRAEGPLQPHFYLSDGKERCTLRLEVRDQDKLTIAIEATPRPLPDAQPAGTMAGGPSSRTKASTTSTGSVKAAAPSDGSATHASLSDFEPKNKPKLSPEKLMALSFPAEVNTGKRYERPFDDALPF